MVFLSLSRVLRRPGLVQLLLLVMLRHVLRGSCRVLLVRHVLRCGMVLVLLLLLLLVIAWALGPGLVLLAGCVLHGGVGGMLLLLLLLMMLGRALAAGLLELLQLLLYALVLRPARVVVVVVVVAPCVAVLCLGRQASGAWGGWNACGRCCCYRGLGLVGVCCVGRC